MTTLLGPVRYERANYYCLHCRQGHCPAETELRLQQRQSPAAREVLTLIGTLQAFEDGASELLPRLTGLRVSASTLQ